MSTDIVVFYIKYILHTSKKKQFPSGSRVTFCLQKSGTTLRM